MDKPTSSTDVVKSLPPIVTGLMDQARLREQYDKGVSDSAKAIKPVFDKMLAVLKEYDKRCIEDFDYYKIKLSKEAIIIIKDIIKEAEELGL